MISIIATGGKQYIVSSGDKLKIEKLNKENVAVAEGTEYKFDKVLLKADEEGNFRALRQQDIPRAPLLRRCRCRRGVLRQAAAATVPGAACDDRWLAESTLSVQPHHQSRARHDAPQLDSETHAPARYDRQGAP